MKKLEKNKLAQMSQFDLTVLRFKKHRLAVLSLGLLMALYFVSIFCGFFSPYTPDDRSSDYIYTPPQVPQFSFKHGLYVYNIKTVQDPVTLKIEHQTEKDMLIPLHFLVRSSGYRFWGLFNTNIHFFGPSKELTQKGYQVHLFGADKYGRDIYTRILYGARTSLTIGLVAIGISFFLGIFFGGISGFFGGTVDILIQRAIEIIASIPRIPLWMALAAIVPVDWSPLKTYFGMTLLLSAIGWTGLARVVRGKILSLREEDYAVAARLLGASNGRVLFRHLVPGFASHIIVSLSMTIPTMVLGETGLSFLGLGLKAPVVSWGVMLQDCFSMDIVKNYPWLLAPIPFLVILVLSFNFLGDGLRDAADPYSAR